MEKIFSKTSFPKAPGGDRYEWKEAETTFIISGHGLFAIKIQASAKNAQQNFSKDDDDLRIALDGFDFGKYERHQELVSWKGFGTSASCDGASLKGGTKTIYFFVELEQGTHTLQFFADETPTLKNIEVFEIKDNTFEFKNLKPSENIKSERKGIPWLSFVFLGAQTKIFTLAVNTRSAKRKSSTDGDNLKVIVNGKVQKNPNAQESYKYKNFYFSGDIKEFDIFSITSDKLANPLAFENAIELWYDEEPEISNLRIEYFDNEEFLERLKEFIDLKEYVLDRAHKAISYFKLKRKIYSAQFLEHAVESNPNALVFESTNPLIKKIKADPIYKNIQEKLKEKISNGNLDGEIWPEEIPGEIIFSSPDLATSLHGIRKIEYKAKPKGQHIFQVELVFFDIYDFKRENLPAPLAHPVQYLINTINNAVDLGEEIEVIRNFEIEIHISDAISFYVR